MLTRPPEEYARWIRDPEHWGGAIAPLAQAQPNPNPNPNPIPIPNPNPIPNPIPNPQPLSPTVTSRSPSNPPTLPGGIELAVLAEHYRTELGAVDCQTQRVDLFGQARHLVTPLALPLRAGASPSYPP